LSPCGKKTRRILMLQYAPFFLYSIVNFEEKNDKIKTITLRLRKENISMEKHTIELKTKP
jgi:hypothetical protein